MYALHIDEEETDEEETDEETVSFFRQGAT